MFDPNLLPVVYGVFFLAGLMKGMVGMGLPLVVVGMLTAIIGLQQAMALLLVPALLTNIWQSLAGGNTSRLIRRFWTLFVPTMVFTLPGTMALARVNVSYLTGLLGVMLIVFSTLNLTRFQFHVSRQWERRLNPLMGVASGLLAGMTGAFTVPGVAYLQSTGLRRDELIQAMGMLFTLSTIGLSLSLGSQNLLTANLGLASLGALLPTVAGVYVGTRVRRLTSEESFRLVFLIALALLGGYIVARSALALAA